MKTIARVKLLNAVRRGAAVAALLCSWALAPTAQAIEVGQAVPDLALPAGTVAQQLSELKGKLVYVDFWASWCGPCRQSFAWMNEMQRKYASRGLQVVAINLDARRADADAFLKRHPAEFALAFDAQGESARRIGVKAMPTSVLVAPNGTVLLVHQGFREEDREALEARLVSALPASKAP
jgi:cytochrome c biogenesis protein CcmG, thiol:disulfide interchange protein DsbE